MDKQQKSGSLLEIDDNIIRKQLLLEVGIDRYCEKIELQTMNIETLLSRYTRLNEGSTMNSVKS